MEAAAGVGALSKQCGELSCGTVSPHGPGSTKYLPPLIVIWLLTSFAKRLDRLAFKDARFTVYRDSNDAESLALKMA